MPNFAARLQRVFFIWPTRLDWLECAVGALAFGCVSAVLGFSTGLFHFDIRATTEVVQLVVATLFIPVLAEEAFFRGVLIPRRGEGASGALWIVISTLLFVAWHALETLWLPNAAATFLRADFLAIAALLGLACGILRWRSGSIWSAVALHWGAVVAWQATLSGLTLAELR